jgi:hypothetical protein
MGRGGGLGGSWGWAALNTDHTGDLVITFCGHLKGYGGGAGNEHLDVMWTVDSNGMIFFTWASDPSFEGETPIPAAPGHYSQHPAPGVAVELTVKTIPGRTAT